MLKNYSSELCLHVTKKCLNISENLMTIIRAFKVIKVDLINYCEQIMGLSKRLCGV